MHYTPNSPPSTTGTPAAPRRTKRKSWLDQLIATLPKLRERAATLLEEGYRFIPDPATHGRILIFKPSNTSRTEADYNVDLWKEPAQRRFRYRCTCLQYRHMERNSEIEPECKHGIAVVAEYRRIRTQYFTSLKWVDHVEGIVAPPRPPQNTDPAQMDPRDTSNCFATANRRGGQEQ